MSQLMVGAYSSASEACRFASTGTDDRTVPHGDSSTSDLRYLMDTDTQVLQDVIAELKESLILHHTQLSVAVQDGIVTISGRANTLAERNAIERAAKRVAGIRRVDLEIRATALPDPVTHTSGRLDPQLT
jgi:BON domain